MAVAAPLSAAPRLRPRPVPPGGAGSAGLRVASPAAGAAGCRAAAGAASWGRAIALPLACASLRGLRRRTSRGRRRLAATAANQAWKTRDDLAKRQRFELLLHKLNNPTGEGSIRPLSDKSCSGPPERFSTGILSLDLAMGGGWRRGCIIEIFGPEASGKTTLALHAIAKMHKLGGRVLYVDVEQTLDMDYARRIGIKDDLMAVSQPGVAEMAMDIIDVAVSSRVVDLVVLDSVAALSTQEEVEKDMGQETVSVAKLMRRAVRKLKPVAAQTKCSVIFINQLRSNMDGYGPSSEVPCGGTALTSYSSLRVEVRAPLGNRIGKQDQYTGVTAEAKVVKNRFYPPHKTCEFDITYGQGVSRHGDVFQAALEKGFIQQGGAWFKHGEGDANIKFQGKEKFVEHLQENEELCKALEELCLNTLHDSKGNDGEEDAEDAEDEDA